MAAAMHVFANLTGILASCSMQCGSRIQWSSAYGCPALRMASVNVDENVARGKSSIIKKRKKMPMVANAYVKKNRYLWNTHESKRSGAGHAANLG
eukprot:353962-Chlamydomonas_euryale.AAC.2